MLLTQWWTDATGDGAAWSDRGRGNKMIFVGGERKLSNGVTRAVRLIAVSMIFASAIAFAMAAATPIAAIAEDFTVDTAASEALTNYLRQKRLPLVGAQIGTASAGARRLVLYGYVATQIGKSDAESKAVAYLGSPRPEVVNRIVIRPEIAKMKSGAANGSQNNSGAGSVGDYAGTTASGSLPGESIDQVLQDIQQYGIKSVPQDSAAP
jgi:hypothetical protein